MHLFKKSRTLFLATVCSFLVGLNYFLVTDAKDLSFNDDVLPIFRAKCIRCHAGVEPKGNLNLTQPSSLLTGGKSGAAIRIGAAEFSLLYEKIASDQMPEVGQKLTPDEKGIIRTWINEGASGVSNAKLVGDDDAMDGSHLWSFNPPQRPSLPAVNSKEITNPIDAFVVRRLKDKEMSLAPQASRETLLRRAKFDLLGLPPTPDEVWEFVHDDSQDAYQRMIERLLASPHYGERWGRHWLDVAGYADSAGVLFQDMPLPHMYRFRDYVIEALNGDKPYDRFLLEQIAGDELTDYWTAFETMDRLPDDVVEGITATGFLRTAPDPSRPDFKTIKNADAQYYYPTLFDTLQIVCSTTMGLTVQCARCHSHKFDPITQVDYYRMQAVFMAAYRPKQWVPQMNRRLKVASKEQLDFAKKRNAEINANLTKLEAETAALKKTFVEKLFESRLAAIAEAERSDVQTAFLTDAKSRTETQKTLVEKHKKQLRPEGKELDDSLAATFAEYKKQSGELTSKIAAETARRPAFDEIRALYDLPGKATTPVLLRGDPLTPGPEIQPGVISTIETDQPFEWSDGPDDSKTSGRRLAFARWLTQPNHPLTARVMVNRIWMHHFGRGIVDTPDDFGVSGSPPTHPQLLDWLATEFVEHGWSIKHIHRLILTSNTWRQQSRVDESRRTKNEKMDPDNRLLWRQSMRRLDAEPLRDSVLSVAGLLQNRMLGRPTAAHRQGNGEVTLPGGPAHRRSIYVQILRLNPETMLSAFDQPRIAINCTQRGVSTVSTQALTLLNSKVMVDAANAFAKRGEFETDSERATFAVMTTWGRRPSDDELVLLTRFLIAQTMRRLAEVAPEKRNSIESRKLANQQALADLCHMLLSSNEFAYID